VYVGNRSILLPDERVVCRGPDGIILTTDGWISEIRTHRHEGITQLFRMIRVSQVQSIDFRNPAYRTYLRALLLISLAIGTVCAILLPFSWGLETLWGGHDPSLCTLGEDGDWVCPAPTSPFYDALLYGLFSPWLLGFISIFVRFGKTLELRHELGMMKIEEGSSGPQSALYLVALAWCLLAIPDAGSGIKDGVDVLVMVLIIALVLYFSASIKRELSLGDDKSKEIHDVTIDEFHRSLSSALGVSEDEESVRVVVSLGAELREEISEIKSKLENHDALLSQIVVNYPDIFGVATPWMGITGIGASTEILLGHRIRQILPNSSKEVRTLANFRDQLKVKDPGMTSATLRSIDVIRTLRNSAAHDMEASKEDYISALQRFVEIVEWHLSTPAQSIVNT